MRLLSISIFAMATFLGACDDDESVIATARDEPALTTFVAAVEFASVDGDLVDLLADDDNSLTVFAPTNQAFDLLAVELTGDPAAVGADLLTEDNRALLRDVLQYHLLGTEVFSFEIPFGSAITTIEGSIFKIDAGTPPVITDGRNRTSAIVAADLDADNGVIHVIDRVLLPANMDIVETVQAYATGSPPEFTVLLDALVAADLDVALSGPGPFTVFAPTDAAFQGLLSELGMSKATLLANKSMLTTVLTYHVVSERILVAEIPIGAQITTVEGEALIVDSSLDVIDARNRRSNLVSTDIFATNGVIHVIDGVLLPAP